MRIKTRDPGYRLAALILTAWIIPAPAQTFVEPEYLAAARNAFDSAAARPQMRCKFSPLQPALNFSLRFQTGYEINMPLNQFRGTGHKFAVLIRVTPEGGEGGAPSYLSSTESLPEGPSTSLTGEITGRFAIGEGAYGIEALLEDDAKRVCRGKWRVQAKRSGIERELISITPPGTIEEVPATGENAPVSKAGPGIGRLTIMIDAAPLSPRQTTLRSDDVELLTSSLLSLLEQLPARYVRLVVFNLDQQAVLFHKAGFVAPNLGELITALNQAQLASVDVSALQRGAIPVATLVNLIHGEVRDPNPSNALILLGPGTRTHDVIPREALAKDEGVIPPTFYIQFFPRLSRSPIGASRGPVPNMGWSGGGFPPYDQGGVGPPIRPSNAKDSIEQLLSQIKGETIPVRTPHDFVGAIRRIAVQIGRDVKPPEVARGMAAPAALTMSQAASIHDQTLPASTQEDPTEVLMRLRDQVLEHGSRIPNHTCVETIQRDRYEPATGRSAKSCDTLLARRKQPDFPAQLRLDSTDRLRLDVALEDGQEIYSWAGASKFEEGDIDKWLPAGAIGTGPFAAMLLGIFEIRNPNFAYEGDIASGGRQLMEYSFHVAQEESQYRAKAGKGWVITGYTGTLLLDPRTAELVRLTVRTEELPPETTTCETDTTLEYGMVALGGNDYLLPAQTRQRFIGREGFEAENSITFASCREYKAASTLSFGEGLPAVGSARGGAGEMARLPAGLPVTVELTTPIHGDAAAAGDRIEGRLARPIHAAGQQTELAPEGARVAGRLMRVEKHYLHQVELTVALRWETLEINGVKTPLLLIPNRRVANPRAVSAGGLTQRGIAIELPLPGEGRYGVYHFSGSQIVVESGFRTEWLTADR